MHGSLELLLDSFKSGSIPIGLALSVRTSSRRAEVAQAASAQVRDTKIWAHLGS